MNKTRVFIATTEGPVEVQRLEEEDPEVRSVICLRNTSEALPVSPSYDAFVRRPTGIIQRIYGHPTYRMDVSDRITGGNSWQLGVFVAHALKADKRLASKDDKAERVLWLTGEVDSELNIIPVEHISQKLSNSSDLFTRLAKNGISVSLILPKNNYDSLSQNISNSYTVLAAESISEVLDYLNLSSVTTKNDPNTTTQPLIKSNSEKMIPNPIKWILVFSFLAAISIITYFSSNTKKSNVDKITHKPVASQEIISELIELRAPANSNCAAVRFGTATPKEIKVIPSSSDRYHSSDINSLCGIRLTLHSESKQIGAKIDAQISGGDQHFQDDLTSQLASEQLKGKKIQWKIIFSRRFRKDFHYKWDITLDGSDEPKRNFTGVHTGSL